MADAKVRGLASSLSGGNGNGDERHSATSQSPVVAVLLAPGEIDDGQDAYGVEDGDADEPGELLVARALPHAGRFPNAVP